MGVSLSHRPLLIAGPTASGKSALALELAGRVGGEIVCADSMQVYAGLRALTARPDTSELARAPHHLFGHVDPAERYSAGRWLDDALETIRDIDARGRTAILVGGTGLYFRALTEGLADVPEPDAGARERAKALLETGGADALAREARRLDPAGAAKVEPNDRQRLLRIVAVGYSAGRPLSALQQATAPPLAPGAWRGAVLDMDRDALAGRIAARLEAMIGQGALDEVAALMARDLPADLPAMKALGVASLAAHLRGEMSLEAALERAAAQTRQYAKRQRTWFRNQTPDWPRVDPAAPGAAETLARALDLG